MGGGRVIGTPPRTTLPVVLDDSAAAAAVIDCSAALAHLLHRELDLVYVQNTLALEAAAWPSAQALAPGSTAWQPFAASDVERGWRAQAARTHSLADEIGRRRAVAWSLRTVRGALERVALALSGDADLLFIGASAPAPRFARPAARWLVALDDGSADAAHGRQVAAQLAQAWGARVLVAALAGGSALERLAAAAPTADAWVVPRALALRARLGGLRCPVLLVAAPA